MQTLPPLPVVATLAALIDGLFEAVAARYGVFPVRGPLIRFLWTRFFRVKQRFATLAARFAAGQDFSPRPSRPRGARAPRPARDETAFRLNRWVNPKFGWLRHIASESVGATAFAWALRHLLTTDPEMRALLAATPATARMLRPLCWMLGVEIPKPAMPTTATREMAAEPTRVDTLAWPGPSAADRRTTAPPPDAVDRPADLPIVFFKAA